MIDFQAAQRERIAEPLSEHDLEPSCAMVCEIRCYFVLTSICVEVLLINFFGMLLLLYIDKQQFALP